MLVLATAAWGLSFPGGKALLAAMQLARPGNDEWFYSSLMIGARFGLGAMLLWVASPRAFAHMRASEWRQGVGLGPQRVAGVRSGQEPLDRDAEDQPADQGDVLEPEQAGAEPTERRIDTRDRPGDRSAPLLRRGVR